MLVRSRCCVPHQTTQARAIEATAKQTKSANTQRFFSSGHSLVSGKIYSKNIFADTEVNHSHE